MSLNGISGALAFVLGLCAVSVYAADQVWFDASADNTWSTNALTWDAGALWVNGNGAVFSGAGGTVAGETVEVSNDVVVAGIAFQTNGYVIADADGNGTLTLAGAPSVVAVANAGDAAVVSEVVAGNGFQKTGAGRLQLTAANTYTGVTTVSAGTLRLNANTASVLGASGAGNHTVVEDGATLDVYSAYSGNVNEDFVIQGAGVGGLGALVNTGPTPYYNVGYRNLTLTGAATLGGSQRFDMAGNGTFTGNGFTLTKAGGFELAVSRAVNGSPIVINAGNYTIQHVDALGGATAGDTTLNGGKLLAWGNYTVAERLIVNGGTLSSSGTGANTLKFTGNMTLNSNVVVQTETSPTNTLELAGAMDGAGGFTRAGGGFVQITGEANTYSGPTLVNGGSSLWVGKTVGGTGKLGAGAVTNSGTLYANSAALGGSVVVNSGTLYCNPPLLQSARIINAGTLHGTSSLQVANGLVNSGTLHAYSGDFTTSLVTNYGTLNLPTNVFAYGQFVNHGTLNFQRAMTVATPLTFNGGTVHLAEGSNTLYLTGPITVNTNFNLSSVSTSTIEVSNVVSGPGGITRSGDGWCLVTGDANTYTGPTIVNGGKTLWVGKPGGLVSARLGPGAITNNGTLYFDSPLAYTTLGGISGTGTTDIRYGGAITVNGGVSSNGTVHVANGSLTLTNGALFRVNAAMTIANRDDVGYSPKPTVVVAVVNVTDGALLDVANVTFGNGIDLSGGVMTGILNQAGGGVRTTGVTDEGNGIRLGHYPQTRSFYNLMGGSLTVEGNRDLCCATDGQGWFNMTGGEVFTTRVMLNERDSTGGFGRLTVAGGVLNLGTTNPAIGAVTNAITADLSAPYLVEYGGSGGTIRAVTNIFLPLNATVSGSGAAAITFDSQAHAISLSGRLSGAGGFNKAGVGTLTVSATNTCSGAVGVQAGTLALAVPDALTNATLTVGAGALADLGGTAQRFAGIGGSGVISNGTLAATGDVRPGVDGIGTLTLAAVGVAAPAGALIIDVATDGTCDVLHVEGDLSLAGLSLHVANEADLQKGEIYTVATCTGELLGTFGAVSLPDAWYVYYDWANDAVQLRSNKGTLIRLK